MIRVTIQDTDQTISFLAEYTTVLRLIAGCSINPKNLDELIVATDIYQRGLAAALMADLMEFDKSLHRQGADFIHQEITQARQAGEPLKATFQVVDDITAEESKQPRGCSLIMIDLINHTIQTSRDLEIPRRSDVNIQIGETQTERLVSYILPEEWEIESFE